VNRKALLCFLFFAPLVINAQEALRGEVRVELEPIAYSAFAGGQAPLEDEAAYRRALNDSAYRLALEEAAMFFTAWIYGWSFHYDVGERARGIAEEFELTPLGEIPWGDPGLSVTHARFENYVLSAWMDYRPADAQRRRLDMWKMGKARTAQAAGYGPPGGPPGIPDWIAAKRAALEDSARAAVRAVLQGGERNRPREVTGFISLRDFPSYRMDAGRWAAHARFRVEIAEIIPFAAY
jgi:hypothetical protein